MASSTSEQFDLYGDETTSEEATHVPPATIAATTALPAEPASLAVDSETEISAELTKGKPQDDQERQNCSRRVEKVAPEVATIVPNAELPTSVAPPTPSPSPNRDQAPIMVETIPSPSVEPSGPQTGFKACVPPIAKTRSVATTDGPALGVAPAAAVEDIATVDASAILAVPTDKKCVADPPQTPNPTSVIPCAGKTTVGLTLAAAAVGSSNTAPANFEQTTPPSKGHALLVRSASQISERSPEDTGGYTVADLIADYFDDDRVKKNRLAVAALSVAVRLGKAGRDFQNGSFVNAFWGKAGTRLCKVQMISIRVFMIWPLQAVAPCAFGYWTLHAIKRLRGISSPSVQRPKTFFRLLGYFGSMGLRKGVRFLFAIEALFFLYYHFKRLQLQRRAASHPILVPGEPMQVLRRTLDSIQMIQAGGRLAEPLRSSPFSLKDITPKSSAADVQQLLHTREDEACVEHLLRDWQALRVAPSGKDHMPTSMTDRDRAVVAKLVDDAEVLALKQAEASGWFLKRDNRSERWPINRLGEIRRGNVKEWCAWAFYNAEPEEVPASRQEELEQLVDECISWLEIPVESGYNREIITMRLTMDPIPSSHRPLIYYLVTAVAFPVVTEVQLIRLGFKHYWSGTLLYWHRPQSVTTSSGAVEPPIVFCHGIGVNVMPYVPFLNEMLDRMPSRSFFLISLPHISMRIKEEVPSSAELVACLCDMLGTWGFSSAHFVGHSFGSLVLAWMARRAPNFVSMLTFIDPVCFLLCKPDVCFNFMYRKPSEPTQLLINYFLAKELYIAHSLSRNFIWHHNLLWPEDLPCPTLVVLDGLDSIIPAHSVRRYLSAYKQRVPSAPLNLLWFPDLGHGELNFGPVGLAACTRIVSEMIRREAEYTPSDKR
eukprot:TRINITY_DN30823_c0_g1_i1.p1 TRINITY_DN30823_c0_g1~~TRINITY_DN30823_c0_g1_i1.p1  ORF type:complete len:886 (-),score=137.94 TRINITY_DN30823_c0_g1_i1:55-2712(-)